MVADALPVWAAVPTYDCPEMLDRCLRTLDSHADIDDYVVIEGVAPRYEARNRSVDPIPDDALVLAIDDDHYFDGHLNLSATIERLRDDIGCIQLSWLMPGRDPASTPSLHSSPTCFTGGGMLFRKSVWDEVGGFPPDHLEMVMFSAQVYAAGYRNYRSTHSYGRHEPRNGSDKGTDHAHADGRDLGECEPERYGVTGERQTNEWGVESLAATGIKTTPELRSEHRENRKRRRWS